MKPGFSDRIATFLTSTKSPRLDSMERLVDELKGSLLILDQAECELLIVVFRANIGHVKRHIGQVAGGVGLVPSKCLVRHLAEIAAQSGSKALECFSEGL